MFWIWAILNYFKITVFVESSWCLTIGANTMRINDTCGGSNWGWSPLCKTNQTELSESSEIFLSHLFISIYLWSAYSWFHEGHCLRLISRVMSSWLTIATRKKCLKLLGKSLSTLLKGQKCQLWITVENHCQNNKKAFIYLYGPHKNPKTFF